MSFFDPAPVFMRPGIAVVRIITGTLLICHGSECFDAAKMNEYAGWFTEKHYSMPAVMAYAGKIAELLAGIGFALGFLTRLASLAAIAAFTGIIFLLGDKGKVFEGDQHPFLFILLAIIFYCTGPGALALDNIVFKRSSASS